MKFKIKYADKVVGVFIIIGILSISILLTFMGINQRWFATNYSYNTRFLTADGLRVGMPIRYKGFQIGQIRKVGLSKEFAVEVQFYIYGEYIDLIAPNTIIQKITSPIGLGSDIIIHPGRFTGEHLPEDSFIPSFNIPEGRALIESGLVDITTPDGIMDIITPVLNNVTIVLDMINKTLETVNKTLEGEQTLPAGQIVRNIEVITHDLGVITSELSGSRELNQDIDEILFNINSVIAELTDFIEYLNISRPQITGVLEESRGALREGAAVMEGLRNNPLLRRGITQQREQAGTQHSIRKEEF